MFLLGFSGEATEFLLSHRDVSGLGTECVDVELGWKTNNKVQHYVLKSKILENGIEGKKLVDVFDSPIREGDVHTMYFQVIH